MRFAILYTMDGCPHCDKLKDIIYEGNIDVDIRNIKDHEKEYQQFVEASGSEYLPAFTLVETKDDGKHDIRLNVPDEHFQNVEEAAKNIKVFLSE
jgi:glutaredoxin